MPVKPTYPGIYIESPPGGSRTVTEVATSIAAFVGPFRRGLINRPVQILSMSDFEREFGGLMRESEASYAVQQFFLNGGSNAWIVRVGNDDTGKDKTAAAKAVIPATNGTPALGAIAGRRYQNTSAENPGDWGNNLRLEITPTTSALTGQFNLTVTEVLNDGARNVIVQTETFANLSADAQQPTYAVPVVNEGSRLIQIAGLGAKMPAATGTFGKEVATLPKLNDIKPLSVTLDLPGAPKAINALPLDDYLEKSITENPTSFARLAQGLQAALREAANDPDIKDPMLRPYLAGATVQIVDDGAGTKAQVLIRTGRGSRSFDPGAKLRFGGNKAAKYGLDPPSAVGPQQIVFEGGQDGTLVSAGAFAVPYKAMRGSPLDKTGLYALDEVDLFNILCIPDAPRLTPDEMSALYTEAVIYAENRRAMLIVDIPEAINAIDEMQAWMADNDTLRHPNAALYFPRTIVVDPESQNRRRSLAVSGTIAGLWARTDAQRGVWKAPAGTEAQLRNVVSLSYMMTDPENGTLNPIGVNCLRSFPIYSHICWGARTLHGADQMASQWKYVPIRRLTLFIEESLYRGTKWVVFEPNDEPLWSQIRMSLGAFMHDLFRKGAFEGSSPRTSYYVKCDAETTTQSDRDNGIVNIEVGFLPPKPAEFVVLRIRHIIHNAAA